MCKVPSSQIGTAGVACILKSDRCVSRANGWILGDHLTVQDILVRRAPFEAGEATLAVDFLVLTFEALSWKESLL